MQHEKIIKRPDGTRVHIVVTLFVPRYASEGDKFWAAGVWEYKKGGKKPISLTSNLGLATPEEIYQAKLELWEKIKPELIKQ
jgi:hypothetical protein